MGDTAVASAPVGTRQPATRTNVPLGVAPFDERTGGIQAAGSYLIVGVPGPAKMVAALQFLHAGLGQVQGLAALLIEVAAQQASGQQVDFKAVAAGPAGRAPDLAQPPSVQGGEPGHAVFRSQPLGLQAMTCTPFQKA